MDRLAGSIVGAVAFALFGAIAWWVVSMGTYVGSPMNFIVGGAIVGFFIGMSVAGEKD